MANTKKDKEKQLFDGLTALLADPEYHHFVDTSFCASPFSTFVTFNENKISETLSWLLSPREGHHRGDFFIKRLLLAYYQEKSNDNPNLLTAIKYSWANTIVETELTIQTKDKKDRRIDLFLVNLFAKTLIIIERKDGSKAHSQQLKCYADWAETEYPKSDGWNHIFILSDSCEEDHGVQRDDRYVQLNDDWISNALTEALSSTDERSETFYVLRNILYYIFGTESEKYNWTHEKIWQDACVSLAQKHADFLRSIQVIHTDRLRANLWKESKNSDFFAHYLPNRKFIEYLLEENEFSQLQTNIENLYIKKAYPSELLFETYKNSLLFTVREFYSSDQDKKWPFYFGIHRKKNVSGIEQTEIDNEIFELRIHFIKKDVAKEDKKIALKLSGLYKTNYRGETQTASQKIAEVKNLSEVSIGDKLHKGIQDFFEKTKELSANS